MDLTNATFIGLMTIGLVNILTMFQPDLDSRYKFGASIAFALALSFIPVSFANILLDHLKTALEVAAASSGAYKIAQKAGGPTLPPGGGTMTTVVETPTTPVSNPPPVI